MAYFRIGTTDYIYALRGGANLEYLLQLANTTAAAGTWLDNGTANPWNLSAGDGCSLLWNGDTTQAGFRLYATRGGNAGTSFKVATWNGSALVWSDGPALLANSTTGTYLSQVTADPADPTVPTYRASGTITTGDINPVADSVAWGSVSFTETQPANTGMTVTVQGWNGAWVDLVTSDTSPIDVSSYPIATYTKLRLRANLSTTAPLSATPRLDDWAVTSMTQIWQSSGSLTCANCHNVHSVVQAATDESVLANWWEMSRVSNPTNTKNLYDTDTVDDHLTTVTGSTNSRSTLFCLECHDSSADPDSATAIEATVTFDTLIPYSVGFTSSTAPFFPGWNKQMTGADWENSAHNRSNVGKVTPECSSCHDPHGSANKSLVALTAYRPNGAGSIQHPNQVRNDTAAFSSEEALCYACHNTQAAADCSTGAGCHTTGSRTMTAIDVETVFTAAANTYKHPVATANEHSDTETAADLGPAGNRHSECADCHDPHAARAGLHTAADSKAGNALRGATGIKPNYPAHDPANPAHGGNWTALASTDYTPERMTGEDTDFEAYVCFKCHSSYSGQPFSLTAAQGNGRTYISTDVAMEFNPSNQSEHNVLGQSVSMETAFIPNATSRTWTKPLDSAFLVTGWTSNSKMTCTDCHTNNSATAAKGPHGSSTPWMILTGYTTWTNTSTFTTTTLICFKCHTNLATSNKVHDEHDTRGNEGGYCRYCHVKVPHGWKRPRLIGYTTDPQPYATIANGIIGIEDKSYTPGGWGTGDCNAGCDTNRHPTQTPLWP
jgi:hypothetical protein